MGKMRNKKGFTLMEMLIVIAIIAILIAIAIPTFSSTLKKAKLAADEANVRAAYAEYVIKYMTGEITEYPAEDAVFTGDPVAAAENEKLVLLYFPDNIEWVPEPAEEGKKDALLEVTYTDEGTVLLHLKTQDTNPNSDG